MLAAGLGSMVALGGCDTLSPMVREHRSMQVAYIDHKPLSVENANGWIEAIGRDRSDVAIEFELYGHDPERLQFATVHADRMGDESLRVWVEWPGGVRKNNEGASISIELPDADGIEAHSSNGHISIDGLSGHADLRSSNGSIRVEHQDGAVFAETSNADIKAEHVSGEIEMYSSNGNAIVTDAFGPIRVETSNGHVFVSTMDGNEGPIRISTSNGRVDLDLGDGFVGVLKCQTSNGKVQVEGLDNARLIESSGQSIKLRFGDSEEVSAARTSNGSIRVRNRHSAPDANGG